MSKWRERRKKRKKQRGSSPQAPAVSAEVAPTPAPLPPPRALGVREPAMRLLTVHDPDGKGPLVRGLVMLGIDGRFDPEWSYATDDEGLLIDGGTVQDRWHYFLEGASYGELATRVRGGPAPASFLLHVVSLAPHETPRRRAAEEIAGGIVESRCSIIDCAPPMPREGNSLALRPVVVTALPHSCQLETLRELLNAHNVLRGTLCKGLRDSYRTLHWAQLVLSGYAASAVNYLPKKQWKALSFPYELLGGPDKEPRDAPKGPGRAMKRVLGELKKASREVERDAAQVVEALRAPDSLRCLLAHREGEEIIELASRFAPLGLSDAGRAFFAEDLLPALRQAFTPGAGEAPRALTEADLARVPEPPQAWTLVLGTLGEDGPRLAETLCYAFAAHLGREPEVWSALAERWWGVQLAAPVDAALTARAMLDEGAKGIAQLKKLGRVGWGEVRPSDLADIRRRLASRIAESLGPVLNILTVRGGSTRGREGLFERVRGCAVLAHVAAALELPTSWSVARRLPGLQRFAAGFTLAALCSKSRGFLAHAYQLLGLQEAARGPLHSFDATLEAVGGKPGSVLNVDLLELGRALFTEPISPLGGFVNTVHWAEGALFCPDAELLARTPWTGGGEREAFADAYLASAS